MSRERAIVALLQFYYFVLHCCPWPRRKFKVLGFDLGPNTLGLSITLLQGMGERFMHFLGVAKTYCGVKNFTKRLYSVATYTALVKKKGSTMMRLLCSYEYASIV